MSDRTAAEIFGFVFVELKRHLHERNKLEISMIAERIYDGSKKYDFSRYQMECESALLDLGIAPEKEEEDR